jgi:signal transduction histidine kinase
MIPTQEKAMLASTLVDSSSRLKEATNLIETLFETGKRLARANAAVLAVVVTALLIVGDYVTGIEIAFTLLYLLPLGLAAWWRGRPLGVFIAVLCVCGAMGVEIEFRLHRGHSLHPLRMLWNHGGSFAIFVIVVELLVRLRAYTEEEARERRVAVEQLRRAERLGVVGKLAAGIAHELGTPLNVIVGHAELIDSGRLVPAMIHASTETILAQTEKMTKIIRGLLDFSRRGEPRSRQWISVRSPATLRFCFGRLLKSRASRSRSKRETKAPSSPSAIGPRSSRSCST